MSLESGTRLGAYEIIEMIGAGGMGEVYRARDEKLDRDVAIKILPDHVHTNAAMRERLRREARAAAAHRTSSSPAMRNSHFGCFNGGSPI